MNKAFNYEPSILVKNYAIAAQRDLETKINKIYFREMRTKWASHSQINNLTINSLLKYLPEELVGYIVYHEIAHNIERKHNENFWSLVNKKFPEHKTKEKDLLTYWVLIEETKQWPIEALTFLFLWLASNLLCE